MAARRRGRGACASRPAARRGRPRTPAAAGRRGRGHAAGAIAGRAAAQDDASCRRRSTSSSPRSLPLQDRGEPVDQAEERGVLAVRGGRGAIGRHRRPAAAPSSRCRGGLAGPRPRARPAVTSTGPRLPSAAPPGLVVLASCVPPPEDQRRVLAAEPERVRDADPERRAAARCSASGRGPRRCSSGSSRLIVGGTQPSRSARIVAIASIAPAAPSVWPSIDLLAVTATLGAWSPKIVRIACSSALSPSGVEVAWALTWSISGGRQARLLQRPTGGPHRADAAGRRQRDVRGVGRGAVAHELRQRIGAARLGVLERLEDQHAAALADHEAVAAAVERAGGARRGRRCGWRAPSSTRSRRRSPRGSPASDAAREHQVRVAAPDRLPGLAQGVAAGGAGRHGGEVRADRRRVAIATWPAPDVRDPHRDEERRDPVGAPLAPSGARCRTAWRRRPGPDPRMTPVALGQVAVQPARAGPAWSSACARADQRELDVAVRPAHVLAVQDAARVEVPDLAGDLRRRAATGRTPRCRRIPDRPATRPSQVDATSLPSAVTMPMPVTTTRRGRSGQAQVIGPASPCGRWRRGRRRPGARARRWRSRRPARRTSVRRISAVTSPSARSTSAHEAVGSPSKT